MEEDRSFVAPGHLPSRWHWPLGPQHQQGFPHPQPHQKNAHAYQYNAQSGQNTNLANPNDTWSYQNTVQYSKNQSYQKALHGYQNGAQTYQHNIQGYQDKAQAYQSPETFHCGPCNRTFHSRYLLDRHLQEHVECPFPECHLKAHPKAIERHIDNQHLLVNFANLQIDDEAWIAERKRRFPTRERAELRRAQQLEKAKRGEKLGKSTKPFAPKDGRGMGKGRGRDRGRGRGRGRGRDTNIAGDESGRNEKRPGHSEKDVHRGRKRMKMMQEGRKNKGEEACQVQEQNLVDSLSSSASHEEPRRQRKAITDIIRVPDPDSDEETERDGIPAFRGTRHFYESTGEVSYFGTKSSGALEHCFEEEREENERDQGNVNHISDEEEDWNGDGMKEAFADTPTVPVLGGALGSLMGAYSDSGEDSDSPEQTPEAGRRTSEQDRAQSHPKNHINSEKDTRECDRTVNKGGGAGPEMTAAALTTTTSAQLSAASGAPVATKTPKHHRRKRHPRKGGPRVPKGPRRPQVVFPRRRKTLLERLLLPDITRERNIILQCVRFIVQNNYFLPEHDNENKNEDREGEHLEGKDCNGQDEEEKIQG